MKEGGLCIVFTAIAISLLFRFSTFPPSLQRGRQSSGPLAPKAAAMERPSLSVVRTLGRTLGGGSELSSSLMVIWRSRTFDDP